METDKSKNYKTVTQLNPDTSPSTSAVVCFDGIIFHENETTDRRTFVEISDCMNKIRLFKYANDTWDDFTNKLDMLAFSLMEFSSYCKKNKEKFS